MDKVYLDYAATTPVDRRVLEAMLPYFGTTKPDNLFGNPGSLHSFGQAASAAVFRSRQTVAHALGCEYQEVIFTGSATEANNVALRGAVKAYSQHQGVSSKGKPRIIISAIEHESILETAKDLERGGVEVVVIPVSKQGVVDLKKLKAALNENTVLVSVMYANNETGVIQPIAQIAEVIKAFRLSGYPLLHTDASQAFNYMSCNVNELGVDLLTISSQKIYGPKGAGALYVRSRRQGVSRVYPIHPIVTGGGQEQTLRSGTENVPAIVGFAKAVELAEALREQEARRVATLCEYAWKGVKKIFPQAALNGPNILTFSRMSEYRRLANNIHFYVPGLRGEQVLVSLDLAGVAISSGSACTARSIDPSHVLLAMGFGTERAKNSLRLTLGRPTTKREIDYFLKSLLKYRKNHEGKRKKSS